jgi:putative peptide zinc metalloprotease protein
MNPDLLAQAGELVAEYEKLITQKRLAQTREVAEAQIIIEKMDATREQMARLGQQLDWLKFSPPLAGTWIAPNLDQTRGAYLRWGGKVGLIASLDEVFIRSIAGQDMAAILFSEKNPQVEIRVKGRPDMHLGGKISKIIPAGQEKLPSAALGYAAGGSVETLPEDQQGTKTAEPFFEIQIRPDRDSGVRLLSGQLVVARFSLSPKPLLVQWWRVIQQLVQRRFHI